MTAPRGLDVPFQFSNTRGSPAYVEGVETLDRSIRTILRTVPGERVHRPDFGCWLSIVLFANMTQGAVYQARSEARRALKTHEKRVDVRDILFEFEENTIWLTIVWRPNGRELDETSRIGFVV